MDTDIQPISKAGWTKVDGVQPVKDDVLVEVLWGVIGSGLASIGTHMSPVYASEVDWQGLYSTAPHYWRYPEN